jgi:alpha-beta hydrolase superfamily lysophospholipase
MRFRAALTTVLTTLALVFPALLGTSAAGAIEIGPAPTSASLSANGAFAHTSFAVPNSATPGFGAATIYHPVNGGSLTFGGVAIVPGFTGRQSAVAWLGPRLASHGFVVITIDTNSLFDGPPARGDQLLAALAYLTNTSAVKGMVDPTRLAVMGHSMGGGGALEAAKDRPDLIDATVGLSPWNTDRTWPEITSPSLVVGAQRDTTAPVTSHAKAFYNGMTRVPEKEYVELAGAGHSAVTVANPANPTVSANVIAWLKRFVDGDTRYSPFVCGPTSYPSAPLSASLSTCPV